MAQTLCRILEPGEYTTWDSFVEKSPQGTLYHTSYWLSALQQPFSIYGYFKGGQLFGGCAIPWQQQKRLKIGIRPPFTLYLGIICREGKGKYTTRLSEEKEICMALAAYVKKDFDALSFPLTPFTLDAQPYVWEGFGVDVRYTYLLKCDNPDTVWEGMDHDRKNNISRAQKDGVTVETTDDFGEVLKMVDRTFDRIGSSSGFSETATRYHTMLKGRNQCRAYLVRDNRQKLIASAYIAWDTKRAYYVLGGYDNHQAHQGAVTLAVWDAIRFTKESLHLGEFDFDGSMIPEIEKFFRKFGGVLTPYYTVEWKNRFVEKRDRARDIKRRIKQTVRTVLSMPLMPLRKSSPARRPASP